MEFSTGTTPKSARAVSSAANTAAIEGCARELGARAEAHPRCLVRIGVLGAEIRDAQRMLERGAGRDYLDEDAPQMLAGKRTRIERRHPVEHRALARGLVDRGAAGLLEMADRLRDFRALVEQAHELRR